VVETKRFELGKYYRHTTGKCMHIVGTVETTMWGWTFVAEEHSSNHLAAVGFSDDSCSVNWHETTEDDWMTGFSK